MKLGQRFKDAVTAFRSGLTPRVPSTETWDTADYIGNASAMSLSAVYGCVKIISETIGMLPTRVYRSVSEDRELATDRSEYKLLKTRPNKYQTPFGFKQLMTATELLWGRAYAEKELALDNKTTLAMHYLHPTRCLTKLDDTGTRLVHFVDGQEMPPGSVFYLAGPSFDGIHPKSVLGYARTAISAASSADLFGAKFFENDARPGGVINYPGKFTGADDPRYKRLKADWEANHRGAARSHGVDIFEDGMKFEAIGMPLEDAQFLQTRKFNIAEIARFFRVPLHKLHELDKATFSNIEHQSLEFVTEALMPWITIWDESCDSQLIPERDQGSYFTKTNVNALLRGDLKSRYEAYAIARQWGWRTVNEILRLEDENGIGPAGDVRLVPLNMGPLYAKGNGGTK